MGKVLGKAKSSWRACRYRHNESLPRVARSQIRGRKDAYVGMQIQVMEIRKAMPMLDSFQRQDRIKDCSLQDIQFSLIGTTKM
jgi:hypothetical protein